jgi:hypothetical protein
LKQSGRILARQLDEVVAAGDALVRDPLELAGRILDADNVLVRLGEQTHGLGAHVDDGTAGDIVDEDRQRHGFGDRREMGDKALLRRLVIIGVTMSSAAR